MNVHVPPCCFLLPARTKHKIWDWIKEKPDSRLQNFCTKFSNLHVVPVDEDLIHFIPCCLSISISKVDSRGDGCVTDSVQGILSQCIYVSNYHVLHLKYLTILFVNCTSIKLINRRENISSLRRKPIGKKTKQSSKSQR